MIQGDEVEIKGIKYEVFRVDSANNTFSIKKKIEFNCEIEESVYYIYEENLKRYIVIGFDVLRNKENFEKITFIAKINLETLEIEKL